MDAQHIAFVVLPYPAHVNPTLPIVSALVRRGHRVTYVTSEKFSSAVVEAGAEVVPCSHFVSDAGAVDSEVEPVGAHARRVLADISPFYEENRPAVILYDFMALAGRILARISGVPSIQTSPFYAFLEGDFAGQVRHEGFRNALVHHAGQIKEFLRAYGITSQNYRVDKEKLNLYLFPRAIQPRGGEFGDNCYFVGRSAGERIVKAHWQDHSGDRPIALVSMSNARTTSNAATEIPQHFFMSIEALSSLGWHVVLSVHERCNQSPLHPLPPHCEIIRPGAFLKVLSRSRLLLFNSGIVTTAEAAYHGVPMVAITEGVGEFEWQGAHLAELGIGVHLKKEATSSANIREAAIRLSRDRSYLDRVLEVKRAVRQEPGAEETAGRIEKYLVDGA